MRRTLIVPGLDASPKPHWQHWLATRDPLALTVDLSDPCTPDPDRWEEELAATLIHHPGAVLVCHSLGAVLAVRLLQLWPQLPVGGLVLVAPADSAEHARTAHFGPVPEAALPVPALVVASRNDPWMEFGRSLHLARRWGAELVDMGHAGHINTAAGFGPWPGILALRDRMRRAADRISGDQALAA